LKRRVRKKAGSRGYNRLSFSRPESYNEIFIKRSKGESKRKRGENHTKLKTSPNEANAVVSSFSYCNSLLQDQKEVLGQYPP
jgi:hypothetical protein